MIKMSSVLAIAVLSTIEGGCGLGVSQLPEVWDRGDPYATAHEELQIKKAIFCELRAGALGARSTNTSQYYYDRKQVMAFNDAPLPDSWGAQVTLTLTADEKSALTPSVTIKDPLRPGTAFSQAVAQSFSFGLAATLSQQNVRYDKFSFYYTAGDLVNGAGDGDICTRPPTKLLGPISRSSPFIDGANLGVREWLPGAIAVVDFQRSSRAAANGEGDPLSPSGFTSDSATYDNKFVIISDGSIAPTWNLVRVSTATSPLLDLNRTRTHELLITVGPGPTKTTIDPKTGKSKSVNAGPSLSALFSHLASDIGNSVRTEAR